ncbi:MAG: hypothetical protein H5T71_00125, partial [Chloroflexi bacterium]|nr:hypothetical protein [Chloroflexota bacterium]
MKLGNWVNGILEEVLMEREIDQQKVETQRVGATEEGMTLLNQGKGTLPVVRTPIAKPA